MALQPLFIIDIDTVKERLRLSGVPSDRDAQRLIEEAVRSVRVGFYRYLTESRVLTILATAEIENPTTGAGAIRQLASVTELKWIRYELMRTIPTLFFDSSASAHQSWQEDQAMLRGVSSSEKDMELKRLWLEISSALGLLEGDVQIPEETSVKAFVVQDTPYVIRRIGNSLTWPS